MDELDRMYRRLVQNIRAGFPDLLTRPFEVSQLYQHIIPYRLNRRELGLDSNEAYELTLLQLLSGARGLLKGEADMQNALRSELESSNPDLTAFRAYATSTIALDPDALRALDAQPIVRSASPPPAPTPLRPAATTQVDVAARDTEEVTVSARPPLAAPVAEAPTRPPRPRPSASPGAAAIARPQLTGCRYCGGELPDSRTITFCPHCGQNLAVKHCPACSTELEVDWRFCITCGRDVE